MQCEGDRISYLVDRDEAHGLLYRLEMFDHAARTIIELEKTTWKNGPTYEFWEKQWKKAIKELRTAVNLQDLQGGV